MSGVDPVPVVAYVGLGSNLATPVEQIASALRKLSVLPGTQVLRVSSCYRTAPIGLVDQPDFVNAVASLRTTLGARALLDALLAIEKSQARERSVLNGPRTIDLDLLTYGEHRIEEAGLVVPHPRMEERAFVMVPLAEIAPNLALHGGSSPAALAARLAREQRFDRLVADAVA